MKKLIKYFLKFLLGLLVLIILAGIFSQTPTFRNWLKDRALAILDDRFGTQTTAKSLQGNLVTYIQLEDLSIELEEKPFLKVKRAFLRYSLMGLFFKRIEIREIVLEAPQVDLIQQDETSWNYSRYFGARETVTGPADSKFDWTLITPKIQVRSGAAKIQALSQTPVKIPQKIQDLDLDLGVWIHQDRVKFSLENLSFQTFEPEWSVRTVQSQINLDSGNFQVSDFALQTSESKLTSNLAVKNFDNPILNFLMKAQPISLAEVRGAFPDLEIYGSPRIDVEAKGPLDDLNLKCLVSSMGGKIEVSGTIQVKNEPFEYDLSGKVSHLNLREITNRTEFESDLNCQFRLQGKDIEWGKMNSALSVDLDSSFFYKKNFAPSHLNVVVRNDTLDFTLDALAEGASAMIEGSVHYSPALINYQLSGRVRSLDIDDFYPIEGLSTNLGLDLELQGNGVGADSLAGFLNLTLVPSEINHLPIESGKFSLKLEKNVLRLDEFTVSSPLGTLIARGGVSLLKENALTVEADFADFSVLSKALPSQPIHGKGIFSGKFEGPIDSLRVGINFELEKVGTSNVRVEKLKGVGSGLFSKTGSFFDFKSSADDAVVSGVKIEAVDFKLNYADSLSHFEIDLTQGERLAARTSGTLRIVADNVYEILVDGLNIMHLGQKWQKVSEATQLNVNHSKITLSELRLASGEQKVSLSGNFTENENALSVNIANFDISKYDSLVSQEVDFEGFLDLAIDLTGTLRVPEVKGEIQLRKGKYLHFAFDNFQADFGYRQKKFDWRCVLSKSFGDSLMESSGRLPAILSVAPFESRVLPDEQLTFKLSSRGLDLSFLQAFIPGVRNAKGVLVADIVISNTLNNLRGVGPVRLINGEFHIPELGTKYEKVNVVLVLRDNRVIFRDFRMRCGDGYLEIIQGDLSVSEYDVEGIAAKFKLKNFELMNNKKMRARARGEIELSGSLKSPQVSGELIIDQARINYKEWFEEETAILLTAKPFFVISADSVEFDSTGALRFQKSFKGTESSITDMPIYRNLRAAITLNFPRNAWIRSNELNIEINGELSSSKEGEDIVLFGSLSTLRGYYQLLGKRFQIKEGKLVFKGKPEPDPDVSIEAVHEFRDDSGQSSETHEFKVLVSGTLSLPKFEFVLDGQQAKQEDVLSVLLFGQKYEHVTTGLASEESDNPGLDSRAAGILTRQLMGQLTKKLGEELSLDVIQFERGKDWRDSKVRVGKYLTPKVFVSVSQDFSTEGSRKVELEYEIPIKLRFLNLFLQASTEGKENSAMDVIWKIEW